MLLKNPRIMPKKSLNKTRIPKASIAKPITEYFIKIKKTPVLKQIVPLGGRFLKNAMVLYGPKINESPTKNKILPNASKDELNSVIIPSRKNKIPNYRIRIINFLACQSILPPAIKPTPNSNVFEC